MIFDEKHSLRELPPVPPPPPPPTSSPSYFSQSRTESPSRLNSNSDVLLSPDGTASGSGGDSTPAFDTITSPASPIYNEIEPHGSTFYRGLSPLGPQLQSKSTDFLDPPEITNCNYPRSSHTSHESSSSSSDVVTKHLIDLAAQVPPSALPPLTNGEVREKRFNGKFVATKKGKVKVKLGLKSGGGGGGSGSTSPSMVSEGSDKSGERARLLVKSDKGNIELKIFARSPGLPFSLKCHSAAGSINLMIPFDFNGSIRHLHPNGSLTTDKIVKSKAVTLHTKGEAGLLFIGELGNWTDQHESLDGGELDDIYIETMKGNVKVSFYEGKKKLTEHVAAWEAESRRMAEKAKELKKKI